MAQDPKDVVYDLLERYITFLPFDAKLDYLAHFVRTGQIERVDNPNNPEDSFAFRTALEKVAPSLTREDAEIVTRRLLKRFILTRIDSMVARELTAQLPQERTKDKASTVSPSSHGPFKVVIANHGEPLVPSELAEFLTLFGDVYALAANLPENQDPTILSREFYVTQLGATVDGEVDKEPPERLVIERIRKASPLTIWFGGIVTLVIIAAILSGGEVKFAGLSCKLNALGDGLKKLKGVFADQPALARRAASKRPKSLPPTA